MIKIAQTVEPARFLFQIQFLVIMCRLTKYMATASSTVVSSDIFMVGDMMPKTVALS